MRCAVVVNGCLLAIVVSGEATAKFGDQTPTCLTHHFWNLRMNKIYITPWGIITYSIQPKYCPLPDKMHISQHYFSKLFSRQ